MRLNVEKRAGIYITVNATDLKGRKLKNLARIRSTWGDFDGSATVQKPALQPSIIVNTSAGKHHVYWLVADEEMTPAQHRGVEEHIAVVYGADRNAVDLMRVLRLPGFWHRKAAPFMVRIVPEHSKGTRYATERILAAMAPIERPATVTGGPEWVDPDRVNAALGHISADDRDVWRDVGAAIKHQFAIQGFAPWCRWSATSHKYDADDQRKTWDSLNRDAAEGPVVTMNTLFDKAIKNGWKNHSTALEDFREIFEAPVKDQQLAPQPTPIDLAPLPGASDPFAKVFGKSAAQWIGVEPKPARFVIDKLVPEGFVTLLVAAGGRGKSLISLQAMVCVAGGVPFLGYDVAQGKAAAIFCEDEPDELHRRTKAICGRLGVDFEQVADRLWPSSRVGMDAVLWTDKGAAEKKLKSIREAVAIQPGLKLLVLDGVSFLFAAPEQDRGQVTRFIAALTGIAQAHGLAILLIHHESKTTGDNDIFAASGSTAWINACRSVLKLAAVPDYPDRRTLVHIKTNRGARQLPVTCSVDGGGFYALSGDRERQRALAEALHQIMRKASADCINLSPSKMSPKFYGPRWLAENQGLTDFTADEFERAIAELMSFGLIEIENYDNKGKPATRYKLCILDEIRE